MPASMRGPLTYAAAVLLISINQAVSKLLVEQMNQFILIQVRMAVTCALCLAALRNEKYKFGPPGLRLLVLLRGILGFLGLCCTYYALRYLSLPDKAALAFLVPLATTIGAAVLLGEFLLPNTVAGSLVSLLGVVVIARPPILFGNAQSEHRLFSIGASLIFVVLTAAGLLVIRSLRSINPTTPVLSFALVSFIASSVLSIGHAYPQTVQSWCILILTGVLGFSIQYLETLALKLSAASEVVNLRYTQLPWAMLWQWLLWHENPDPWSFVGAATVVGGVAWGLQKEGPRFQSMPRRKQGAQALSSIGADNKPQISSRDLEREPLLAQEP